MGISYVPSVSNKFMMDVKRPGMTPHCFSSAVAYELPFGKGRTA